MPAPLSFRPAGLPFENLMPIACLDVNYLGDHTAKVAGVLFNDWADEAPAGEQCLTMPTPGEYEPGQFYKREMPCLLELLRQWPAAPPDILVIDGYVTLGQDRPGLGHHLYHALGQKLPVIGVAKRNFQDNDTARSLLRGGSRRPLFITAIGMDAMEALECIQSMHGPHRMPTLLRRADQLSRGAAPTAGAACTRPSAR